MGALDRLARLPNWPIRLSEDLAAAYLGISKTTFRTRWQANAYPQPIREGRRLLWNRRMLDRFVDNQAGLTKAPAPDLGGDDSWADFR